MNKIDVGKLKIVLVDLKKLSDIVDKDAVKKTVHEFSDKK